MEVSIVQTSGIRPGRLPVQLFLEIKMGIGSNVAVEDADDQYKENAIKTIAKVAAALVASGECTRKEAIEKATEWFRQENKAAMDPTGSVAAGITFPAPMYGLPASQIAAIAAELLDDVRDAVDWL